MLSMLFVLVTLCLVEENKEPLDGVQCIVDNIRDLEDARDPKCHATATRLINFMYGTPLTEVARFRMNALQKNFIRSVWRAGGPGPIDARALAKPIAKGLHFKENKDGSVTVTLADGSPVTITERDRRHYGSVAYGLRAQLAVQQEAMLSKRGPLPVLTKDGGEALKEATDIHTLAALFLADQEARAKSMADVSAALFEKSWLRVAKPAVTEEPEQIAGTVDAAEAGYPVLSRIVAQKIHSYKEYNKISDHLFWSNISTFFARYALPNDEEGVKALQDSFRGAAGYFAAFLFREAGRTASQEGSPIIREHHVSVALQKLTPFQVNEYEDVTYFFHLQPDERIILEAYDTDAFRDSGLHWIVLKDALNHPQIRVPIEPDPFAAELLVEGIAQFGVLTFRIAGLMAKNADAETVQGHHIRVAVSRIQELSQKHIRTPAPKQTKQTLVSTGAVTPGNGKQPFFVDHTAASGIQFEHRSSDWLSRYMRSYLYSTHEDKEREEISLDHPPSFSGAGVASEDIDNDGLADILLLSGSGDKLYKNLGDGRFKDITRTSGIEWHRKDGSKGEPRQPIIADLDNDGLRDILITYVDNQHKLFKNLGGGTFKDVSDKAGLGGEGMVVGPATVFDYDRDGLLDIYIGYYGNYLKGVGPNLVRNNFNGTPNQLLRNKGNLTFEDKTKGSGLDNKGWTQAVVHTDLDGDGWQDLIVGNDFGVNAYYRNRGDGTFEDLAGKLGTNLPSNSMNVGLADLNRDSHPDVYISNIVTMVKDESYRLPTQETRMKFDKDNMATMRIVEANHLFVSKRAEGKLTGYEISDAITRGLISTGWAWDADFFDFDNDGDDDLYCVNGLNEYRFYSDSVEMEGEGGKQTFMWMVRQKESNVFFVNESGKLENRSTESGADMLGNSRSAAYLDIEGDGDLDMILNNYHSPAVLYRNNAERYKRNWMRFKLVGDPKQQSNRDAIGARILVKPKGGPVIWREINGSIGYMSQHPKATHVGLGDADIADVTITWPNGETTEHKELEANKIWRIEQAGAE